MSEWFHNLPVWWMTLVVFAATYGATAIIYWTILRLAVDERARAFKALSPGMLPPLGIIFGLLVGFVAVQVWTEFDHAKAAVVNEASALRSVVLLAANLSPEEEKELRGLVSRHVEKCVNEEWRAMSEQRATLILPPAPMVEALQRVLAYAPSNDGQRTAQREIVSALKDALDARRQRIVISQSSVNSVKWTGLLLQALITLIAIAMVHSDNRSACAIALALFSTGVALSLLLIASFNRPFTGEISVRPDILQQVMPDDAKPKNGL
jgi:hypothetical protein